MFIAPKSLVSTLLAIGLAWLAHGGPVAAQDAGGWTVARLIGTAWIINPDRSSTVAQTGSVLLPGQTFATSPNGRAMIVSGQSVMMLTPGTLIAIKPGMDGKVVVLQQAGQMKLHVEHRDARYFSVETPYLAALVKGTTFSVNVKNRMAKVDVAEGSVQVDGFIAGQSSMLGAGQSAAAMSNGAMSVEGQGTGQPAMTRMERREAEVKPSPADGASSGASSHRNSDGDGGSIGSSSKSSKGGSNSNGSGGGNSGNDNSGNGNSGNSGNKGGSNSNGGGNSGNGNSGNGNSGNSGNKGGSNSNGNGGGNSGDGGSGKGDSGNKGGKGGKGGGGGDD